MAKKRKALVPTQPVLTTRVKYVGDRYPELQGSYHVIDASIENKAAFIEAEYAKHLQRLEQEAAQMAEREALEAAAAVAAEAETVALEAMPIAEPVAAPAPQGDAQEQLALAASLSNVSANLLTQSKEAEALQAQVFELQQTVQRLLDEVNQAGIAKAEALALVKNSQQMIAGMSKSTSQQIEQMRSAIQAANDEAQTYRAVMTEHLETVDKAVRITDAAVDIAKQTAQDEVDQMWDQFVASTNAVLVAAGVGRNQFLQILNSGMVQGEQAVIASREELATYVNIMRATSAAQDQTDENITIGASQMRKQKLEDQIGDQPIAS